MNRNIFYNICLVIGMMIFVSCSKTSYYKDSGTITPVYSGSSLDFLKSKGYQFDSLVKIIHLAGLDDVIANGKYTFFAPGDSAIKLTIQTLNYTLKYNGKDTVSDLSQISSKTWRETLSMYIFDGINLVNDYPQLELNGFSASLSFPGQAYTSFEGARIMNIGCIYEDASGVKYAGYRHLVLSYIPSYSAPLVNLISNAIATSNIVTSNGVIHALQFTTHVYTSSSNTTAAYYQTFVPYFGFNPTTFYLSAVNNGIAPAN